MAQKVVTSKDAFSKGGKVFGFQEGRVRFDKVESTIDQADFKQGKGMQRFCVVRVHITQFDEAGNPMEEQEFPYFDLKVGDAEPNIPGLDKFHPGQTDSADSDNVEDLGAELEVTGNTLVAVAGKGPADNSKYALFTNSMAEIGFRQDILAKTFFPDWVGFECDIITRPVSDDFYEKKKGTSNPSAPPTFAKGHTVMEVVKGGHKKFPYEAKTAAKAPSKAPAKAPAATPPAKTAAPASAPAAPAASANGTSDTLVAAVLLQMAIDKTGTEIDRAGLRRAVQSDLCKVHKVKPNLLAPHMKEIDDDDNLRKHVEEIGATWDEATDNVTFA